MSFISPSRNNITYLKWMYNSIRKNLGYRHEILLADDCSQDGTWEWLQDIQKTDMNIKIFQNETGDIKPFTVTEITDSKIVLDGNHPLCNIKINFNVTILNIRDATKTEINALNEVTEN